MRLLNRVLAALLSLALIIASVLLIIEVIAYHVSNHPAIVHWQRAYAWAHRNTWNAGSIRVTCVILIVAGLVLLVAELKPPRVSRLAADPAQAGVADIDTAYTRHGIAAAVRTAAVGVDGIRSSAVKVKHRKVRVTASAAARDKTAAQSLHDPVSAAVGARLTSLGLRRSPSVSVRITPRSR